MLLTFGELLYRRSEEVDTDPFLEQLCLLGNTAQAGRLDECTRAAGALPQHSHSGQEPHGTEVLEDIEADVIQ